MEEYRLKVNLNLNTISLEDSKALIQMLEERIKEEEESKEKEEKAEVVAYDAIMKQFYKNNENVLYPNSVGNEGIGTLNTRKSIMPDDYKDWDNCMTEKQCKRIQAFNKLQNIAKYLNDTDWEPDFKLNGTFNKPYEIIKGEVFDYAPMKVCCNEGGIYFQTEDKANRAIEIMGKESLDDLFATDW